MDRRNNCPATLTSVSYTIHSTHFKFDLFRAEELLAPGAAPFTQHAFYTPTTKVNV